MKAKKRPRYTNQLAKRTVDIATGDEEDRQPTQFAYPTAANWATRG